MAERKYDTTLARIAGDIAGGCLADPAVMYPADETAMARCAKDYVALAQAIVEAAKKARLHTGPAPRDVVRIMGLQEEDLRRLPLNVQAVFTWCRDNNPGLYDMLALLVRAEQENTRKGERMLTPRGSVDLMLVGFEAGRQFERDYPHIEPGSGYLQGREEP